MRQQEQQQQPPLLSLSINSSRRRRRFNMDNGASEQQEWHQPLQDDAKAKEAAELWCEERCSMPLATTTTTTTTSSVVGRKHQSSPSSPSSSSLSCPVSRVPSFIFSFSSSKTTLLLLMTVWMAITLDSGRFDKLMMLPTCHAFSTTRVARTRPIRSSTSTTTQLPVSSAETYEEKKKALGKIQALEEEGEEAKQERMRLQSNNDKNKNDGTTGNVTNGRRRQIRPRQRKKYQRKRPKPPTEEQSENLRKIWEREYEQLKKSHKETVLSIFSFESLFAAPVLDEATVQKDLYGIKERDEKLMEEQKQIQKSTDSVPPKSKPRRPKFPSVFSQGKDRAAPSTDTAAFLEQSSTGLPIADPVLEDKDLMNILGETTQSTLTQPPSTLETLPTDDSSMSLVNSTLPNAMDSSVVDDPTNVGKVNQTINRAMTRMVEDRVYGFRRTKFGDFEYDTSLLGDRAVQFREGVRLGRALKVNADRLTYLAKKEMKGGHWEEAQELYEKAIEIDPYDGRAYLGLSRIAQRRRDYTLARQCLRSGIANSISIDTDTGTADSGSNPFLLQALGVLEEQAGHLSEAEALYISAIKSRPSHAAAWVSLAQLRTRKLRQSASAGRVCYQAAVRESKRTGKQISAHVYTAWAAMEYKQAGDVKRARELFDSALEVDPRCSVAYLQYGVMEAEKEEWEKAAELYAKALKYDKRNSRILQAYAILETKRPDGSSRKAIDLFEKARKANPRDAGVLQAYALFVADLGDVDSARGLLEAGTRINKRYAPLWQAWGVLETRHGRPDDARNVFQQGIWQCAQIGGGQSGGYNCARLWQAWGVLEARMKDFAAARRCFSRALDADNLNVPTITAWSQMEEELGNDQEARFVYERSLKLFPAGSDEKTTLWRSYELMEQRIGDIQSAQQVYQRSIRESMGVEDMVINEDSASVQRQQRKDSSEMENVLRKSAEVEVVTWGDTLGGEVWLNDGLIEAKVPNRVMKKKKKNTKASTKQQGNGSDDGDGNDDN